MFDRATRLENGLKVAVICTLLTVLIESAHIPYGAIAVITALVLNTVYYRQTLLKAVHRFAGALIGSIIALWMVAWFINLPVIYFCAMLFWLSIAFYLFRCNITPYAMLIGGLTIAIIMIMGIHQPNEVIPFAMGWSLCVGISLLAVWLFDRIWPGYRKKTLTEELIELIQNAPQDPAEYQRVTNIAIAEHSTQSDALCRFILLLKRFAQISSGNALTSSQQHLVKQYKCHLIDAVKQKNFTQLSTYPLHRHIEALHYRLYRIRQQSRHSHTSAFLKKNESITTLLTEINQAQKLVKAIEHLQPYIPYKQTALASTQRKWFTLNKNALKQSIKITLAIVIVLCLELFFKCPTGIQGIIAVTVLTATPNIGRAHWKFYLRLLGVLAGSVIGILSLILLTHFEHFTFLLAIVFVTMGISAYIALGSERTSYFGVQMGVMIPLILLMGNAPITSIELPLDRFMGVLVGAGVSAIVLYTLWPMEPKQLLHKKINQALMQCSQFLKAWQNQQYDQLSHLTQHIEQTDRSMLVDSQFLLYNDQSSQRRQQQVIHAINQIAKEADALSHALQSLNPSTNLRLNQLLAPYLQKLQNNLTLIAKQNHLGYHSIHKTLLRLSRRLHHQRLTRSLDDRSLVEVGAIENSLLKLSNTLDHLAKKHT